ncbi:hypothetical protein MVEG_03955 [Podila verticillata NRRL 6337]|nr:hypothetical protein MVEG_03955 [Podila verticillata NRRL 6337]
MDTQLQQQKIEHEQPAPSIPQPLSTTTLGHPHNHHQQQTPPPEDIDPFIVVRALYPYHSEDTTALSFQQNDLIQVVAQLESGWWYGFCHDARGWFPSNFVEEIVLQDEHDLDSDSTDEDEMAGDDLWLPQTTPDGQVFYYNTRTGDSSWTIPTPSFGRGAETQSGPVMLDNLHRSSSSTPQNTETQRPVEVGDDHTMSRAKALASIHEPTETDSRGGSTRPNSWQTSQNQTRAGSPTAPESIDSVSHPGAPGIRKPSSVGPSLSSAPLDSATQGLPPLPPVSNPFESEPTWTSLADHTSGALSNLLHSADNGYKPYYQVQAAQIVESIRMMLYASGTIDKDSSPIRLHPGLKVHHRQIMAALSRLVLSARMAGGVWPAEGAVAKMRADADDVADSVHQFIKTAQSSGVIVHDVDAKLILDPEGPFESRPRKLSRQLSNASSRPSLDLGERGPNRRAHGSSGVLAQLDYYSKSAIKAIAVLTLQINKAFEKASEQTQFSDSRSRAMAISILNSAQSSQLVAQCHQSISQIGSLLSLVSEFYTLVLSEHPSIKDHIFLDVRVSKQSLYNNIAALVMSIQLATDPMAQLAVLEMTLDATAMTEKCIGDLTSAARALATEYDEAERMNRFRVKSDGSSTLVASTHSGANSNADIERYFRDDSDNETETARDLRQRAESHLSSFSSNSSTSGRSFSTNAGSDYTGRVSTSRNAYPSSGGNFSTATILEEPAAGVPPGGIPEKTKGDIRGAKLKKMLGEDVPTPKPSKVVEKTPWFLGHDYSPSDISFNMEGHVKGGTLPALVERLTLHDGLDSNFVATFLLTYRSFATTGEFFTLLFRRFNIAPPQGLDAQELAKWTERKLTPIRLRVFNIIKSWLENYFLEDEVEDRQILPRIKEFLETGNMRESMSFAAVQLIRLVEKRETSDKSLRKMILNLTTQAPQPITPRNLKRIRFMDLDPLEFARQLTILEANMYNKIKPVECLAKAWTSEDPEVAAKAVNIKKIIETSNLYANWINEIVLTEKEVKKRALILRYLVTVAEKLRQLNNFSMLSTTTAAMALSPVHRLRRTWELVPSKVMTSLANLQAVTSSKKNWGDYRSELHSANPPCVPFVGVYLTDLVMIQDGNPDNMKSDDNHINFYKRVSTAEVIREIQQYQSVPYCLTTVPEIQSFIRRGLDHAKNVSDLHAMSLELEPRLGV